MGAAVTPATARRAGGWADGLVTEPQPHDALRRVLAAVREGGGEGKPAYPQVHLSWADTEERAPEIAWDRWRSNVFGPPVRGDLEMLERFDEAARFVRPDDVRRPVLVSADLGRHAAWLRELADLGFSRIYLHHVGRDQRAFIDAFGRDVLPALR